MGHALFATQRCCINHNIEIEITVFALKLIRKFLKYRQACYKQLVRTARILRKNLLFQIAFKRTSSLLLSAKSCSEFFFVPLEKKKPEKQHGGIS